MHRRKYVPGCSFLYAINQMATTTGYAMNALMLHRDSLARPHLDKRRRVLRLPHAAKGVLEAGLQRLLSSNTPRAWTLPSTALTAEVLHYSSRHKALGAKGPVPSLRTTIDDAHAAELALKVDAGLQFSELGASADPMVKPILLYYACAHLCGVYTRAFFTWKGTNRHHGMSCSHLPHDVGSTMVTVEDTGQFLRLATTCFILTGQATAFSPLVTYSGTPTAHLLPGALLHNFGKTELGDPSKKFTLELMSRFDFVSAIREVRTLHGLHKFRPLPTTAFLVDVLTLFMGSCIARYDVLGWKTILDGRENSYRILFEETYDRFLSFGVDALLSALEDPLRDFDCRRLPSPPSPYSHDDKSRFAEDPMGAA